MEVFTSLAKSSNVLGNASGAHANSLTARVGMSAQLQRQSSRRLCRLALRI